MAEPIEMPFGLRTRVGPGNHVLDGDPDPPWERAILGEGRPIVKYRDTLPSCLQRQLNQLRCRLGCGLVWAQGIVLRDIAMATNFGSKIAVTGFV